MERRARLKHAHCLPTARYYCWGPGYRRPFVVPAAAVHHQRRCLGAALGRGRRRSRCRRRRCLGYEHRRCCHHRRELEPPQQQRVGEAALCVDLGRLERQGEGSAAGYSVEDCGCRRYCQRLHRPQRCRRPACDAAPVEDLGGGAGFCGPSRALRHGRPWGFYVVHLAHLVRCLLGY